MAQGARETASSNVDALALLPRSHHLAVDPAQIRHPFAGNGTVQQLGVHTIGRVATPAQAPMVVVPADSRIEIEAMIQNKDIGFVQEGDEAETKIDTFNFTRYGLLHGNVLSVSADSIVRERPQAAWHGNADKTANISGAKSSEPQGQELVYGARISLNETRMQIERRTIDLAAGMAVAAEIKTGERRVIEYLLSPLLRYRQESCVNDRHTIMLKLNFVAETRMYAGSS